VTALSLRSSRSMDQLIRVEPTQHKSHGACPHCGGEEQTVWGWIHRGAGTRAAYYVRWKAGRRADGMIWLLCIGPWGDGAADADRRSVGLRVRIVRGRPQFMVVDAAETPWGREPLPLHGSLLTREQVIDTPLAEEVFRIVDQILVEDTRVARFVSTGEGMEGLGAPAPSWWRRVRLRFHPRRA
jgi:hypothetical protein